MTYRESHLKYAETMNALRAAGVPEKGSERDEAMRALSCVPVIARDNHDYSYPVFVEDGALYLVGAPSGWNLFTLGDFRSHQIALDYGQGWFCTNIQAVLAELREGGFLC